MTSVAKSNVLLNEIMYMLHTEPKGMGLDFALDLTDFLTLAIGKVQCVFLRKGFPKVGPYYLASWTAIQAPKLRE